MNFVEEVPYTFYHIEFLKCVLNVGIPSWLAKAGQGIRLDRESFNDVNCRRADMHSHFSLNRRPTLPADESTTRPDLYFSIPINYCRVRTIKLMTTAADCMSGKGLDVGRGVEW